MNSHCKITLAPLRTELEKQTGYSRTGLKAMFDDTKVNPNLAMTRADLISGFIASKSRMSISGAQPKRSAILDGRQIQLTDAGGQYIIKPSPEEYPHLAEVEHASMAMTRVLSSNRFKVADNGLFSLSDGELVYITRRFDRLSDGTKLQQVQMDSAMSIRDKYDDNVSYERIGCYIKETVSVPFPVLQAYFEQVVIGFLIGNDDLHIRNLGLMVDLTTGKATGLTPAYDMVASSLYTEGGSFLALPLTIEDEVDQDGTTKGLETFGYYTGGDFKELAVGIGLSENIADHTLKSILSSVPEAKEILKRSLVPEDKKEAINAIIDDRFVMLGKH